MKTLSLLKAVLTCDMNMFKYSAGKNASTKKKILLPRLLKKYTKIAVNYISSLFILV